MIYTGLQQVTLFLERKLKVDVRYLFYGGFWLSFGQIMSSASVFLLGLAFANLLPKETYGTYKYFLSLAALFSICTLPGISASLTRAVARGFDSSIYTATATRVRWGFFGSGIGLLIAAYYAFAGNTILSEGLVIIAIFLPFFDTFNAYSSYLQGKQKFRLYVLMGAIIQIASVVLIIGAIFLTKNLLLILATYFASFTVFRFLSWKYVETNFPPSGGNDAELVSYGKHLTIMNLLSQAAGQADTLLLFHFLGPIEVATYAIAIAAPDQIKNIAGSVADLLLPRLAQRSEMDVRETIIRKAILSFLVMAGIVIVYIAAAPFLYHIFFSRYPRSVFFSQLFSISMLNSFVTPFSVALQAHGKVRAQYAVSITSSVLQILSMLAGVMWAGILGLVIARILTRFVGAIVSVLFYFASLKKDSILA